MTHSSKVKPNTWYNVINSNKGINHGQEITQEKNERIPSDNRYGIVGVQGASATTLSAVREQFQSWDSIGNDAAARMVEVIREVRERWSNRCNYEHGTCERAGVRANSVTTGCSEKAASGASV
jgi:hypothetical protein